MVRDSHGLAIQGHGPNQPVSLKTLRKVQLIRQPTDTACHEEHDNADIYGSIILPRPGHWKAKPITR